MATFSTFQKPPHSSSNTSQSKKTEPSGSRAHAKPHLVPETRGVSEGSSKRNILRKEKKSGSGHHGKKENLLDDGSDALLGPIDSPQPGDPLYDEGDQGGYVLVSGDGVVGQHGEYDPDQDRVVFGPQHTLTDFKRHIVLALEEYFSSEDVNEMLRQTQDLSSPEYNYELVKRAISLSLDRNERERELVSRLLSEAVPEVLNEVDVKKGFERLFELVDEYEIDVPGATRLVAAFLARAVVDEIVPPRFLVDPMTSSLGGDVVSEAKILLSREHNYSRIEKIWGPGDGRPVEELKVAVDQLLQEFLLSRSHGEAARCVEELQSPLFHHEIVKRAIVLAMDQSQADREALKDLLLFLREQELLFEGQIKQGLERVKSRLSDLALDSPCAEAVYQYFSDSLVLPH